MLISCAQQTGPQLVCLDVLMNLLTRRSIQVYQVDSSPHSILKTFKEISDYIHFHLNSAAFQSPDEIMSLYLDMQSKQQSHIYCCLQTL